MIFSNYQFFIYKTSCLFTLNDDLCITEIPFDDFFFFMLRVFQMKKFYAELEMDGQLFMMELVTQDLIFENDMYYPIGMY